MCPELKSPLLSASLLSFRHSSEFSLTVEDVCIHRHEIVGIVGPNGAGKSTFLQLLAGLLLPEQGMVLLGDEPLTSFSRKRIARYIGYLPQGVHMTYPLTVRATVMQGRYPHLAPFDRPRAKDRVVVERVLSQTDMHRFADRRLDQLSGGEFRRALLASVLAQEPKLLLLDEPTAGLDIEHASSFMSLLRQFATRGIGVAVVTHDLNLASLFCHRLVLLHHGVIRASGKAVDVLTDHHLVWAYGGAAITARHPMVDAPMVFPVVRDLDLSKEESADGRDQFDSGTVNPETVP